MNMDSYEKQSDNSLYGYNSNQYGSDTFDTYHEDEPPMSPEEKQLVRKIDLCLLPIICTIDFLQFLDKSTISYAATMDFREELQLDGFHYSFIGSIFYLGYLLYQLPNNYLLQRVPVGRYIGTIVTLWGIVLTCTAATNNFSQVAAMRFLLGFFEAGVYPSLTLLVSTFYRRSEQASRLGAFWLCNGIALFLGGLIAYGIQEMPNTYGLARWKWVMLILGSTTTLVGIFSFFFLIDNPKAAALALNAEQEILVEERTRDNAVFRTTMIKKEQIIEALKEVRFWALCFACLFINMQNGAMTTYNSQIAAGLGFSRLNAVLLSIGTGVIDIIFIMIAVFCVNRYRQTVYTAIGLMIVDIIGLVLLFSLPNLHSRLVGYYLSWAYPAVYVLLCTIISNNVSGYTKKIFYNGATMIFYTIGNFCGPFLMIEAEAPSYTTGMAVYVAADVIVIFLLLIARHQMVKINRERLSTNTVVMTHVEDDLSDIQDKNFLYRL